MKGRFPGPKLLLRYGGPGAWAKPIHEQRRDLRGLVEEVRTAAQQLDRRLDAAAQDRDGDRDTGRGRNIDG